MCLKRFFSLLQFLFCSLVLSSLLITVHTLAQIKYLYDHDTCLFQCRVTVLVGNMRTHVSHGGGVLPFIFQPIFLTLCFLLELAKIYASRLGVGLKCQ